MSDKVNANQVLQEFSKNGLAGVALWGMLVVCVICLIMITVFTAKIDKNYEISLKMQAVVETSARAIDSVVNKINDVMTTKDTIVRGCQAAANEIKNDLDGAMKIIDKHIQDTKSIVPTEFFYKMQSAFAGLHKLKDSLIGVR